MGPRRLVATVGTVAAVATACASAPPAERSRPTPSPGAPPEPLVYVGQMAQVLPKDAIPSIDDPRFISTREATRWLAGREPVISLEVDGDARAYPIQILTRHEIVNDVVGEVPVAVTYCPLCNSALAFEREAGGRVLEFGTSGMLYRSALVMYDRQTDTLWTHFDGLAVTGPLTGTRLTILATQLLSFDDWSRDYPDGRVLSPTGHPADYGKNPYERYDSQEGPYSQFFPQAVNYRLPAIARVVGVTAGGQDVAYPYRDLADRHAGTAVLNDRARGLVIFWRAGTASALDTPIIASGRDVGATGVFDSGGRAFAAEDGRIVDRETESRWSITGLATAGRAAGTQLRPIPHVDAFWFAWQAYRPDTRVYGAAA
jgi:Protein of unknown function (DUF3179)